MSSYLPTSHVFTIKKSIRFIYWSFILFFGFFLSRYPEVSQEGIKEGIKICFNILVPSLFSFIFFSSLMINSGAYKLIGKIFSPLSNILFIPKYAVSVFLLSMIGGYPIGAKGIKDLFDKQIINSEQAERMLMFCVNPGPSFTLGVIGTSLLKDSKVSFEILKAQILSSCLIAIFLGILSRRKYKKFDNSEVKYSNISFGNALINSCETSCYSILNIGTLVVIFNIFFLFLDHIKIIEFIKQSMINLNFSHSISHCIPYILFEVTNACVEISKNGNDPLLFAIATSWGGLCVHMQIFSIIKKIKIKYSKFLIYRLINLFLSYIFAKLLIDPQKIYPRNISMTYHLDIAKSLILISFCVYFLIDINLSKRKIIFKC